MRVIVPDSIGGEARWSTTLGDGSALRGCIGKTAHAPKRPGRQRNQPISRRTLGDVFSTSRMLFRCDKRFHSSRQRDDKLRALWGIITNDNLTSVGFDESLHDRHAKPCPFGLGREKGVENPFPLLLREPRSVVTDADLNSRCGVNLGIAAMDYDSYGIITGHQGVLEDIAKHLFEAEAIHRTLGFDTV